MAAAGIDLVPLVEGGGGRLEHDVELLLRHRRQSPDEGLKLLALDNICQVMVKGDPLSFSFHTWSESLVPG